MELDAFESDLSALDVPELDLPATGEAVASTTDELEVEAAATTETAEEVVDPDAPTTESDEEAASKALAAAAAEKTKATGKQLTFTVDGKPVSMLENAETEWKVDGKPTKVKLRDLLDNYSGKVSYDRKFQELSSQRKGLTDDVSKFQSDRQRHKELITDMNKAVKENRVFDAVANMLEMTGTTGIDARTYVSEMREALIEQAKVLAGLSPQERALQEKQEELDWVKQRGEQDRQRREKEQADTAFRQRVVTAMETAKSTPQEFVQAREEIVKRFSEDKRDLNEVTPEFVRDYITTRREYATAKEAMDAVDPELVKNQKLWYQTVELMRLNPQWTKEDIKAIFQNAVGDKRARNVSKKLNKSPVATAAKGAAKSKMRPMTADADPSKETYSADDLNW